MKYRLLSFIIGALLLFLADARIAFADDVVSANGSQTDNSTQTTTTSQTSIQSSNTSTINNSVSQNTDTGNNSAGNNSGSTAVTTGDATSQTTISNAGNSSIVDGSCCSSDTNSSTQVNGNGSNSTNTSNSATTSQTTVAINQNSYITNTITGTLNTGNNISSGNSGDVTIHTGSIYSYQNFINAPINSAVVSIPSNSTSGNNVKIAGNGSGSFNQVVTTNSTVNNISINNYAELINDTTLVLNTGGNRAEMNVGKVDIETGNIISEVNITNKLNNSKVAVTCCTKSNESPTPSQPGTPPTTTTTTVTSSSNPSGGNGGGSSGGSVLGASTGQMLPITGGNFTIIFIIGNIIMLFLGAILRLLSGRSPSFAFAI